MYPKLYVDTAKITQNVRTVAGLCAQHGLKVVGVSKCVTASPAVARAFVEGGVSAIGDSRIENLMRIQELPVEKWLIRTPSPADAERIVRYADLSLNSEQATLRALDAAAGRQGRVHRAVLMYDLGDLREGFVSRSELMEAAQLCMELPNMQLAGVGANLNCLSFVQPDRAKMEELADVAREMRERWELGEDEFIVTGGNSASLHMMMTEGLPAGITDLRLGESLLIGKERACYSYLPGTSRDAFVIETEVVESKLKPSMPWGTIGPDSYGRVHSFEDSGPMQRAIVTGGNQDFDVEVMQPLDPRVRVVASSCDHTVLDVTACAQDYPVGATVRLECGYHAILRAFTSPYVEKVYV
ncbi:MAG: alanine/ornithine racemase family PLP-dependent enzyme [Coriobacteriales bacterium]